MLGTPCKVSVPSKRVRLFQIRLQMQLQINGKSTARDQQLYKIADLLCRERSRRTFVRLTSGYLRHWLFMRFATAQRLSSVIATLMAAS